MGIGVSEVLLIALVAVLLFGPAAIAAWIAYTIGRGQVSEPQDSEPADPAFVAARERYARGEINRDEYEDIKHTLGY